MAVAIDGEIFEDAYLAPLNPDSELYLIPTIGGGCARRQFAQPSSAATLDIDREKNSTGRPRVNLIFASLVSAGAPCAVPNS
jgi:hypothetical protein